MTQAELQKLFGSMQTQATAAGSPVTIQSNPPDWAELFTAAVATAADKIARDHVARLDQEIRVIKDHCQHLREGQSFVVPIETLAPEPFTLKKTLQVVVHPIDDEYLATLFDANLGMMGDTAEEAVANLKATIVDTFELFEENEATLGPEPKRQLAILREAVEKQK